MTPKKLTLPLTDLQIKNLRQGDLLLLSGTIYTARDQAHKKLIETLKSGQALPIPKGAVIYYTGPTPAKRNKVIGSCGPTTSGRMDEFSPILIEHGYKIMIGKGARNETVIKSLKKHQGLYLSALGGCGALYQQCVKTCECITYPELLSEAIYKLTVHEFPVIVTI